MLNIVKIIFNEIFTYIDNIFIFVLNNSLKSHEYHFIYSPMVQIIGIVTIFVSFIVVFKVTKHQGAIKAYYKDLKKHLPDAEKMTRMELKDKVLGLIEGTSGSGIQANFAELIDSENTLKRIRAKGHALIQQLGILFLYYVLVLHLSSFHFTFGLPAMFAGFVFFVFVFIKLFKYIIFIL